MNKDTTYENFPFWDAYKCVKNGEWTEDDFHLWAQTVWNDGANSDEEMKEHYEGEEKLAQWQINLRNDWLANG
jgi:hypothetical protein